MPDFSETQDLLAPEMFEASAEQETASAIIDRELQGTLRQKVIYGLDAMRALAIVLVLIDHYRLLDVIVHKRLPSGWLGVMIFFVLSGFLITSMLLKEFEKTGSISFRDFYRRRAFRIFPTFYACLIVTVVIDLLTHQLRWKSALVSAVYMMDYGRGFTTNANIDLLTLGISWSLAIEEKFYLLWPLLLLFLLRKRSNVARTLAWIILGQWLYRAILYLAFPVSFNYFYNTFDMRVDALLMGCLLAILLSQERTRARLSVFLRSPWMALIPVLVLAVSIGIPVDNRLVAVVLWMAQPLIIAVLMLQTVYWGQRSWRFCRASIVGFMARISYALYLYHSVGGKIVWVMHFHHLGYSSALIALALSVISYYCLERPMMRLRDRRSRYQPKPSPAGVATS
jgi:peptidoglycan/LPS O-acetylase OafA/YrhL